MSKTKEQIISDYDTTNILSFLSTLVGILGIASMIVLEFFFSNHYGFLIALAGVILAMILKIWSDKCPICDEPKRKTQLWFFNYWYDSGCENCNLSEQQIIDYVESLIESKKLN